jgi:hypothetical protein
LDLGYPEDQYYLKDLGYPGYQLDHGLQLNQLHQLFLESLVDHQCQLHPDCLGYLEDPFAHELL